ncbi:hypothetical protein DHW03_09485 [Pedobacter yonginense]|uniref:Uncharacterized protein n=1 Tax=Pedobacter yonginense TaxID=651869 RepID=A0A317EP97_9SPHI|nr:hypothetical protein [Pedobacter yonginense]PWS27799.1 hypothetical protein DHW03_09485 [Pedobacter yonginense]
MKKLVLILIFSILFSVSYGQKKENVDVKNIKCSILNFLNWYRLDEVLDTTKENYPEKEFHPIIVRERVDTMIKLSIDMVAVENYLGHIKSSNYVSESFINNLRQYHQKIADEIRNSKPYPASAGEFAIPGLNCDVIFGFEPEEILDHIKEGRFAKIRIIYDKAMVKFDISRFNQSVFTLTKTNGIWLIDYLGFDLTNFDEYDKKSRLRK